MTKRKPISLLTLCLSLSPMLSANDPFYGENPPLATEPAAEISRAICRPDNLDELNLLNIREDFTQLKLVGIVQINAERRALFENDQQQLLDFRESDWLAEQGIQIEKITANRVIYRNWAAHAGCRAPQTVTLKL